MGSRNDIRTARGIFRRRTDSIPRESYRSPFFEADRRVVHHRSEFAACLQRAERPRNVEEEKSSQRRSHGGASPRTRPGGTSDPHSQADGCSKPFATGNAAEEAVIGRTPGGGMILAVARTAVVGSRGALGLAFFEGFEQPRVECQPKRQAAEPPVAERGHYAVLGPAADFNRESRPSGAGNAHIPMLQIRGVAI